MVDGVTIGHPCCGVLHCTEPLASNRDRYCSGHQYCDNICCIVDCDASVVPGCQSCSDPAHQEIENLCNQCNKALFQMKNVQRCKIAPPHKTASTFPSPDDIPDDCPDKPTEGIRKPKAQFSRRQTHNEQLAVAPCGICLGRRTFYGSETTPQVEVNPCVPCVRYDTECH
jgi:hypothetical protein